MCPVLTEAESFQSDYINKDWMETSLEINSKEGIENFFDRAKVFESKGVHVLVNEVPYSEILHLMLAFTDEDNTPWKTGESWPFAVQFAEDLDPVKANKYFQIAFNLLGELQQKFPHQEIVLIRNGANYINTGERLLNGLRSSSRSTFYPHMHIIALPKERNLSDQEFKERIGEVEFDALIQERFELLDLMKNSYILDDGSEVTKEVPNEICIMDEDFGLELTIEAEEIGSVMNKLKYFRNLYKREFGNNNYSMKVNFENDDFRILFIPNLISNLGCLEKTGVAVNRIQTKATQEEIDLVLASKVSFAKELMLNNAYN